MSTTSVINQTNATAVIDKLGKHFDSHAFIRKFMEMCPEEYGKMLQKHRSVTSAHGEISNFLRENAKNLGIKRMGNIKSLNVYLNLSSNAMWSK